MSLGVTVVVMLCDEFLITSIMKYVMNESTNNSTTAIITKKFVFRFLRFFIRGKSFSEKKDCAISFGKPKRSSNRSRVNSSSERSSQKSQILLLSSEINTFFVPEEHVSSFPTSEQYFWICFLIPYSLAFFSSFPFIIKSTPAIIFV